MVNTITVAELLSDAGKDVRAAWERGKLKIRYGRKTLIHGSYNHEDGKYPHEWIVEYDDHMEDLERLKDDDELDVITPTPDPLALAEAALRPFAEGYRAYMESRAARSRRDIRDWLYFNADEELLERHYEQAADALEAIRQARGE